MSTSVFRARPFLRWAPTIVALLVAGCGAGDEGASSGPPPERPRLVVSAATSLKTAFTAYGEAFEGADVALSFAGSDELAAQIRQGVAPDVFAAADTKLPEQLFREDLVQRPTVFAANRLVLAVPVESDRVSSLEDLGADGVKIAVGSDSVPIGSYTREVLGRLESEQSEAILANVGSEEPDVGGIVGKLTQGAVDAGFVYVTDVSATDGALRAIDLPARLQPRVAYGIAVVRRTKQPERAKRFVEGLVSGRGQEALRAAGFEPPAP
ncbi:MAG: molybdate ABC transporter substrate-binding protein [Thermoleophilaceae bacterium]